MSYTVLPGISDLVVVSREPHPNLIQFAVWSGLRTSELVAFRWGDIDFKTGVIRVRRAHTQAADKDETTKTFKGRRDVKLLGPAREALMDQKAWTYLAGEHIFHNPRTNKPGKVTSPYAKHCGSTF